MNRVGLYLKGESISISKAYYFDNSWAFTICCFLLLILSIFADSGVLLQLFPLQIFHEIE
jgi:hypothetical protein